METDATSSKTSGNSHVGSFCQSANLNYYSENSFYFANSCKLDSHLAKKNDTISKKIDYTLFSNKNIPKTLVHNVSKKIPSGASECLLRKNGDELSLRKFQTEYFNNNNSSSASDKQDINIQLNVVDSFGNKPVSFSPDQVSVDK